MNTKRLSELYPLCIAGDEKARDEFCDAVGECACLYWRNGITELMCRDEVPLTERLFHVTLELVNMWDTHGRHAPLVSLDCAVAIPMPDGYFAEWHSNEKCYIIALYGEDGIREDNRSYYTTPAERPMAEAFARVWANCHAKEKSDAR